MLYFVTLYRFGPPGVGARPAITGCLLGGELGAQGHAGIFSAQTKKTRPRRHPCRALEAVVQPGLENVSSSLSRPNGVFRALDVIFAISPTQVVKCRPSRSRDFPRQGARAEASRLGQEAPLRSGNRRRGARIGRRRPAGNTTKALAPNGFESDLAFSDVPDLDVLGQHGATTIRVTDRQCRTGLAPGTQLPRAKCAAANRRAAGRLRRHRPRGRRAVPAAPRGQR